MACIKIYQKLLSLTTFLQVHSNSEEVSYHPWQNMYPNLKTTCHIMLKFFLWTKLLKKLLLAKYLISITALLGFKRNKHKCNFHYVAMLGWSGQNYWSGQNWNFIKIIWFLHHLKALERISEWAHFLNFSAPKSRFF